MPDCFRTIADEEREDEHLTPATARRYSGARLRREEHQREGMRKEYDRGDLYICAAERFQDHRRGCPCAARVEARALSKSQDSGC